eukprot:evm.model.scf_195.13 EVM.evm.TU.scf_195.13   scf_195:88031-90711(+)
METNVGHALSPEQVTADERRHDDQDRVGPSGPFSHPSRPLERRRVKRSLSLRKDGPARKTEPSFCAAKPFLTSSPVADENQDPGVALSLRLEDHATLHIRRRNGQQLSAAKVQDSDVKLDFAGMPNRKENRLQVDAGYAARMSGPASNSLLAQPDKELQCAHGAHSTGGGASTSFRGLQGQDKATLAAPGGNRIFGNSLGKGHPSLLEGHIQEQEVETGDTAHWGNTCKDVVLGGSVASAKAKGSALAITGGGDGSRALQGGDDSQSGAPSQIDMVSESTDTGQEDGPTCVVRHISRVLYPECAKTPNGSSQKRPPAQPLACISNSLHSPRCRRGPQHAGKKRAHCDVVDSKDMSVHNKWKKGRRNVAKCYVQGHGEMAVDIGDVVGGPVGDSLCIDLCHQDSEHEGAAMPLVEHQLQKPSAAPTPPSAKESTRGGYSKNEDFQYPGHGRSKQRPGQGSTVQRAEVPTASALSPLLPSSTRSQKTAAACSDELEEGSDKISNFSSDEDPSPLRTSTIGRTPNLRARQGPTPAQAAPEPKDSCTLQQTPKSTNCVAHSAAKHCTSPMYFRLTEGPLDGMNKASPIKNGGCVKGPRRRCPNEHLAEMTTSQRGLQSEHKGAKTKGRTPGRWITMDGQKVYKLSTGEMLEGQAAYRASASAKKMRAAKKKRPKGSRARKR